MINSIIVGIVRLTLAKLVQPSNILPDGITPESTLGSEVIEHVFSDTRTEATEAGLLVMAAQIIQGRNDAGAERVKIGKCIAHKRSEDLATVVRLTVYYTDTDETIIPSRQQGKIWAMQYGMGVMPPRGIIGKIET